MPEIRLKQIQHFFEHYKDLEAGKWVKVLGWSGVELAHAEILDGIKRYQAEHANSDLSMAMGKIADSSSPESARRCIAGGDAGRIPHAGAAGR